MDIITGNEVDFVFGQETTFGTQATTIDKVFGYDTKVSLSAKKNQKKFKDLGKRTYVKAKELKFDGSIDIDFVLANELIWPYIFGDGDGTALTPYIFDALGDVISMTGLANDRKENKKRHILGMAFSDFSMSLAVNEEVKCKMSGLYKTIGAESAAVTRASLSIDGLDDPFTAEHADVQISSTSNYYGLLQKAELKIGNDLKFFWELGDLTAVTSKHKDAIGGITMAVKKSDTSTLQGVEVIKPTVSTAENITVVVTLNDGTRTITMTLTGTYIDEFTTGLEAAEDVDENLVFIFSDISTVLAGF